MSASESPQAEALRGEIAELRERVAGLVAAQEVLADLEQLDGLLEVLQHLEVRVDAIAEALRTHLRLHEPTGSGDDLMTRYDVRRAIEAYGWSVKA